MYKGAYALGKLFSFSSSANYETSNLYLQPIFKDVHKNNWDIVNKIFIDAAS